MTKIENANRINQDRWNELAGIHAASDYYRAKELIADKNRVLLTPIELAEIGDLSGQSLLHLQCHIGIDTLSLARLGATVTGLDYSKNSITEAHKISQASGTPGTFVTGNVYDAPSILNTQFDMVYSNWGSLCWLPSVPQWANVISQMLRPGGTAYVADIHPFGLLEGRDANSAEQKTISYFPHADGRGERFEFAGTYTDTTQPVQNSNFVQWPYTLGDILTSFADNGLALTFFHEHPYAVYEQLPRMTRLEDGLYVRPDNEKQVPLSFTLKAHKHT